MQSAGATNTRGAFKQLPPPPLCHGCLSADRKLYAIGDFVQMLKKICDVKAVAGTSSEIHLCWECSAILKRIQSFCEQVNNAQNVLNNYYYKQETSLPKPLSRLKATETNNDFIGLIVPEPEIKPLDKIKQEVELEDFDTENTADLFDNNDFTYLEDIKSEDKTLIIKLKKIKKEKNTTKLKKNKSYCYISTPEKMVAEEQVRQTDFKDLWKRDRHNAFGSKNICKMCLKDFSENENIEIHNEKYHNERIGAHVCAICQTRYRTQDELARHAASHNTIYRCEVCGHRARTMADALAHVAGHGKVVKCKLCDFYCTRVKPNYFAHQKSMHSHLECDYCGKKCKTKRVLQRHITRLHMESKCKTCGSKFLTYIRLQNHIAMVHAIDRTEASFCVKCNVQFQNRVRYRRHLNTSTAHAHEWKRAKKKEIKCLVCDNRYSRRTYMMNHYRLVHLSTSKYYCQECDKYFLNRSRYIDHQHYNHEGVEKKRDKLCSICGRGFTTNRILTNHMRTHTGERPFVCEQCGARFAQRVARDVHLRRHNKRNSADIT